MFLYHPLALAADTAGGRRGAGPRLGVVAGPNVEAEGGSFKTGGKAVERPSSEGPGGGVPQTGSCPAATARPAVARVTYTGQVNGHCGEPLAVSARLTDECGNALAGRQLTFNVGALSASAKTGEDGVARASVLPPPSAAPLPLAVNFAGDDSHSPAQDSASVRVARVNTSLRYAGKTVIEAGAAEAVSAALTDAASGRPVANAVLDFEVGSVRASATTGADGVATASIRLPPAETFERSLLRINFAGDDCHHPASTAAEVTAYLRSSFVVWGGNGERLRLGQRVNFWGHSWAKQVTGGDYKAHNDFKGYADTVHQYGLCQVNARTTGAPPLNNSCWSTKPGQSFPPQTIPEYIGVIVTTSADKGGAPDFGNIAALVVVKVSPQPPYGANPGKPGFGTIVAVIADGEGIFPQPPSVSASQTQPATVLPAQTLSVAVTVTRDPAAATASVSVNESFTGLTPPTASAEFGALPAAGGQTRTFGATVPALPARADGESSQAYEKRLGAADGTLYSAQGVVSVRDGEGRAYAPVGVFSSSRLQLPRLAVGVSAPPCVSPGATIPYAVTLTNVGSAAAASAAAVVTFPDGTSTRVEAADLEPGEVFTSTVNWKVTAVAPKGATETDADYLSRLNSSDGRLVKTSVSLTWSDALGNEYGPVEQECGSVVRLPILTQTAQPPPPMLPGQKLTLPSAVRNTGGGDAPQVRLRVTNPDGSVFDAPPVSLAAGNSSDVPLTLTAPPVAAKGQGEADDAYRARLQSFDNKPIDFSLAFEWTDPAGNTYGPLAAALRTTEVLPIILLTLAAPETAESGDTITYQLRAENAGHAEAVGVAPSVTLPDGRTQEVPLPVGALPPGERQAAVVTFEVPSAQPDGPINAQAAAGWADAVTNGYGPVTAGAVTEVLNPNRPPVVNAGPDQTVVLPASTVTLNGAASDDGRPAGSTLSVLWTKVSGPGDVTFGSVNEAITAAIFSAAGTYVLRLTASDSVLGASDEATVEVSPAATGPTYGDTADLSECKGVNVVCDESKHLHISNEATPFNFIWVAVSSKGTIVKLDTDTGQVLGEYFSSPAGQPKDPSRTTVDHNGNVWASNRAGNSVLRIGLVENGQCVDRNQNGVIDTSRGQGDIRPWPNTGGADTDGGVETAQDECIINYTRVRAHGTRHVSVNALNDVWVSGTGGRHFDLLDGVTGQIKRQESSVGYGGYGGLIDRKGVIWSSRSLLRWDTALSLKGANGGNWRGYNHDSYGLCIDSQGNVWNTENSGNVIRKFAPDGTVLGTFGHGNNQAQGCVVDRNDHVWVAHSLSARTVGHLKGDGTFVGNVTVGNGPTGVAVDAKGKIWATNHHSRTVSRIDPELGPMGADGETRVGQVDLTTVDLKGSLYNYSDMTGSTLSGAPASGTWTQVFDSGIEGAQWGVIGWNGRVCGDGALLVQASSSADGKTFSAPVAAANGAGFSLPPGRHLKVSVVFKRASSGESPFLFDLTVGTRGYELPPADALTPSADAGPDQTTTMPNAANLVGAVCDTGRVTGLDISWEKLSGPGAVTFANARVPATSATFGEAGEYTLRLTAADAALSASDEMKVLVLPFNDAPLVSAGADQSLILPAAANLAGTVSDDALPKNTSVAVSWSKLSGPGEVTFANVTAPATAVTFSEPGDYVLRLSGDDSQLVNVDEVAVKVYPPNNAPVVSVGADRTLRLPDKAALSATVTDDGLPLGKAVTVAWSKVSGPGTVSFAKASAADTTAAFGQPGTYVLRLTAGDSQLSAADELTAVVNPANQPPSANAGADQTVTLPDPARLSGTVADDDLPEGRTITSAWSKVSGPGAVTFAAPGSPETTASFSEAGAYVLRLSAGDSALTRSDDVAVTVRPSPFNLPPNVGAGADQTVTLPARASLAGFATDDKQPAGGALTLAWSKVSGPGNVAFGNAAAAATTASFSVAGAYVLRLTASDTALTTADEVAVTVLPVNQPPVVRAGADQIIPAGAAASLSGTATDDGQPSGGRLAVAWSKASGPGEVSFASAGAAVTTATFSTGGKYVLRLTAHDGALTRTDDVAVTVNQSPAVNAGADQSVHLPNAAALSGRVTDDALPAGKSIVLAWSKVSGPGTVTFSKPAAAATAATFGEAGAYVLRLTADDSMLRHGDEVSVNVLPPLPPPPSVAIASPADGAELNGRANVVGSVSRGAWKLEYRLGPDPASTDGGVWTAIGSGDAPVAGGVLGAFDPTQLLNGTYAIRLTAADADGRTASATHTVVVSGQQKVGNFTISFEDLNVPVAGLPIQLIRTYDSRDKRVGDFGVGWTLGIKNIRLEKSVALGRHWRGIVIPGTISQYCLQPARPNIVTITFPDDRVYRFQATTAKQCQSLLPIQFAKFGFTPMPGTRGSLVPEAPLDVTVGGGFPGTFELLNSADPQLRTYDPTVFRFTDENGVVFVIDQKLGVRSVADLNGNRLTVNRDGMIHSSGKSVTFVRDAQGRIVEIKDPAGASMFYSYDARGDLAGYKDREHNETTFAYNATHGLLTVTDPRGLQPVRNEYDDRGRLVRQIDALGKVTNFTSDYDNRQEIITDRLGNVTAYEYNPRGQVVRVTDSQGGVTRRTYDARDNLLSETDAEGKTTSYTYDAGGNRLSQTDPLGGTTRHTYNSRGQELTATDPRGRVTAYTYDARGNLTSTKDPLGQTTSATYNAGGQETSVTDELGNTSTFAYDAAGNLTRRADPLGNLMTFTYDANGNRLSDSLTRVVGGAAETLTITYQYDRLGRPTRVTYPDGSTTQTVFNSIGKPTETIDKLGRRTAYEYSEMGRLVRTTYPDGTREEHTYDAGSRVVKSVNRAGGATAYAYDSLDRAERVAYPDGTSSASTYDSLGRVVSSKDVRGNATAYEYDALGRRVKVTDAQGNVTAYTYDAGGNQSSVVDPRGLATRFEYDALNRRTKVIHPDGSSEVTEYDGAGRITAKTDQGGRARHFEYDRRGLLTKVTDALGGATSYTYDSLGNQLSQTDANNHTTTYEYDRMGRRVRRTLPLGMSETYAYDAAGNLTGRTDFNGRRTTFAYDGMNRLVRRTPDPALGEPEVTFAYTATGQRASMSDATGTTTYTYDARDRLTAKRTPRGTLTYTYDVAGNLLTARSSNANGLSVDYAYDTLNRLEAVTDNRLAAGATTYSYDPNGNRASTLYPNGVRTAYTYNALNRLTQLNSTKGATLASYAYTLGAAGNRLSVTELSGRAVSYTYDALYRLTGETVGGDASASGSVSYAYDAVGNRLSRASTVAGVESTTATYNANDLAGADTFDRNGNTLASGGATYTYDSENRLTGANGGAVSYLYDGDGHRVSKTVGGVTTTYLVDTNNPTGYAQVVEELQGGAVVRQYTYGHDLISQNQLVGGAWRVSFYGYDGHGSTRYLTDGAGAVTDTYTYDAFGVLIARTGTTPNDYLYSGEHRDPNLGLDYLRARYMNPQSGRFLTMDTFEGVNADPPSLHKYLYASADPVNRNDPGGHFGGLIDVSIANSIRMVLVSIQGILGGAVMSQLLYGGNAGFKSIAIDIGFVLIGPIIKLTGRALRGLGNAAERLRRFRPVVEKFCFVAGTPVRTRAGSVPIEALKVGDEVLSHDEATGEAEYRKVTATFTRRVSEVVEVTVRGEEGRPIGATAEHPFYARRAEDGGAAHAAEGEAGWVPAGELKAGDLLRRPSGEWVEVVRVERRAADVTVYNFEVADNHNYYVGPDGVLVHNACRLFHNLLPERLAGELARAQRLGVRALRVGDEGFDEVVNAGTVKWAVTQDGALHIIPKSVRGQEIAHTVLTNGGPVLAAGEAEIVGSAGRYHLIDITNHSGHYLPSRQSLDIGKLAFVNHGIEPLGAAGALDALQ